MTRAPKKAAPPQPRWRQVLNAFWAGMTEPSWATLAICLVTFMATVALGGWLFSPAAMAGPGGAYIPRSGKDGDAFATVNAIRLARHQAPGEHQVLLLGSSTIAQAIGSETKLEAAIQAQSGEAWDVHILATPLQSPWDQLKLLETVLSGRKPGDGPLLVAVGVSPLRMGWNKARLLRYEAEPRLGLRSTWVDDEMRAMGAEPRGRTGWYQIDNSRFLLLNGSEALMRFAARRPAVRRIDYFAEHKRPKPVAQRNRKTILGEFRNGAANAPAYLALYQRLASRLAMMPNVRLVFIEEAVSPGLVRSGDVASEVVSRTAMIRELAARNDTEFWPIISESGLSDSDFYDDLHVLRGSPQEKVRATFARRFAAYAKRGGQ